MSARFIRFLQMFLAALDISIINFTFFISFLFFRINLASELLEYTYLAIFVNLAWVTTCVATSIYKWKTLFSFELTVKQLVQTIVYLVFMTIAFVYFFEPLYITKSFFLILLAAAPASLLLNRVVFFAVYEHFKYKDYLIDRVVIVGYNETSKRLIQYFEDNSYNKEIIGICDEVDKVTELYHHPVLSSIEGAFEVCKTYGANEIFTSIAPEQNPQLYKLMQFADQHCIRFRIVPDISYFVKRKVHIKYVNEIPVLTLRDEPMEDLSNRIRKRAFDIVVSFLVIVFILSWLVPLLALLIKLESKGPVFFKQRRTAKGNKTFLCLKFRSMKVNKLSDVQQATKNDQRVTRLGRFMRKTSLDELPQFFNVFMGHMSVVGPRPHMLKHTDEYSQVVNQYMVRHFMKPGITGWAQVNGYRGEIDSVDKLRNRVELDIWYLEHWSIWLDLKIMFLTVYNAVKGEENAF